MKPTWVKLIYKSVSRRAAYRALAGRNRSREEPDSGRFTPQEVHGLLKQVWLKFDQLAPQIPREPTRGNRMNMMLACMTLAFFQTLQARSVDSAYAIELVGDVAWKVYEKWGVLPRWVARLLTPDPVKRMRMGVNMFLRFPFNAPGYKHTRLPSKDGMSLDMHRCPVAEYFRSNDAADLCVGSWCNLDYALAEMWGGWLERSGTLAGGDDRCRFRFKARFGPAPELLAKQTGVH